MAIAMYDDHLEIINPGMLHFDITPEKLVEPHASKPWNPIIASVFYRAGIIEKWGMGTLNMIDWCQANENPSPVWNVQSQSVVVTFEPSHFFATGLRETEPIPESRPESRPESLEEAILRLLQQQALSKGEIAKLLGHRHISSGLNKVVRQLLLAKKIAYTIPSKPHSRLQKYKIQ